ncbi:MAG: TolC family protein, partial [Burkholderiaceae bacterium]
AVQHPEFEMKFPLFAVALACATAAAALGSVTSASAQDAPPLTLGAALEIAQRESPRLAAGRSAVEAAAAMVERSGALPDPKLSVGISNLPVSGEEAWNYKADGMTMRQVGVMQEFPNSEKRRLKVERAAGERAVEAAMLSTSALELKREASLAWFEVGHAQDQLRALEALLAATRLEAATLGAAVTAGRANAAETYAVRAAEQTILDRLQQQQRLLARARVQLARFIGPAAQRPLAAAPDTARLPRAASELIATHADHPQLRVWAEREELARTDMALATAGRKPDWSVELMWGQREPAYSNMVSLQFRFDLPLFQGGRQDRDVASRASATSSAAAAREEARRAYEAELKSELIDWDSARQRVERYRDSLLPLAQERVAAATAAYRGGSAALKDVLETRRMLAETEMTWHDAQLERDRAWVKLNTLVEETP